MLVARKLVAENPRLAAAKRGWTEEQISGLFALEEDASELQTNRTLLELRRDDIKDLRKSWQDPQAEIANIQG